MRRMIALFWRRRCQLFPRNTSLLWLLPLAALGLIITKYKLLKFVYIKFRVLSWGHCLAGLFQHQLA